MKVLSVLTYYRPYTSGLTIYAERLAQEFAARGHQSTVLTMRYDPSLPRNETLSGVSVRRADVWLRVSKGVLSPNIGWLASKLVWQHDAVILHLPQFDAPGVALRARLFGKPVVLTYHCDLQLPPTPFNHLVGGVVNLMNDCSARLCDRIISYTEDFASNSLFLRRFHHKVTIIPPPVVLPTPALVPQESLTALRSGGPVIGMAARLAAEKGVEVLLEAVPRILEQFPSARFAFAGQYENVLGEAGYYARLKPRLDELIAQGKWHFLGVLPQDQMAHYFRALDVLVVPSLNSTESFGLVQIEAMMVGTPVVASNLPGVRQPVRLTGMGKVVSVGDPHELAEGIIGVLTSQSPLRTQQNPALTRFAPSETAAQYERVLADLGVRVEQ